MAEKEQEDIPSPQRWVVGVGQLCALVNHGASYVELAPCPYDSRKVKKLSK